MPTLVMLLVLLFMLMPTATLRIMRAVKITTIRGPALVSSVFMVLFVLFMALMLANFTTISMFSMLALIPAVTRNFSLRLAIAWHGCWHFFALKLSLAIVSLGFHVSCLGNLLFTSFKFYITSFRPDEFVIMPHGVLGF